MHTLVKERPNDVNDTIPFCIVIFLSGSFSLSIMNHGYISKPIYASFFSKTSSYETLSKPNLDYEDMDIEHASKFGVK